MTLTLDKILEAKRLIGNQPILVGIVCKPSFLSMLKRLVPVPPPPAHGPPLAFFGGVDFYIDHHQEEPWKAFFDHDELRVYLNRNE
jgi:hypothetical protein